MGSGSSQRRSRRRRKGSRTSRVEAQMAWRGGGDARKAEGGAEATEAGSRHGSGSGRQRGTDAHQIFLVDAGQEAAATLPRLLSNTSLPHPSRSTDSASSIFPGDCPASYRHGLASIDAGTRRRVPRRRPPVAHPLHRFEAVPKGMPPDSSPIIVTDGGSASHLRYEWAHCHWRCLR